MKVTIETQPDDDANDRFYFEQAVFITKGDDDASALSWLIHDACVAHLNTTEERVAAELLGMCYENSTIGIVARHLNCDPAELQRVVGETTYPTGDDDA